MAKINTDEHSANYTEVLLSMHHNGQLKRWWGRVCKRGQSTNDNVHRVQEDMWIRQDTAELGPD